MHLNRGSETQSWIGKRVPSVWWAKFKFTIQSFNFEVSLVIKQLFHLDEFRNQCAHFVKDTTHPAGVTTPLMQSSGFWVSLYTDSDYKHHHIFNKHWMPRLLSSAIFNSQEVINISKGSLYIYFHELKCKMSPSLVFDVTANSFINRNISCKHKLRRTRVFFNLWSL